MRPKKYPRYVNELPGKTLINSVRADLEDAGYYLKRWRTIIGAGISMLTATKCNIFVAASYTPTRKKAPNSVGETQVIMALENQRCILD